MKKGIAVVLAVLMMGALLVGCGEKFDPSALEKQIEDLNKKIETLEDNNKALEEENKKQQEEVDRANGQYNWDNPIDVKVDEFVALYENNKDEFLKVYTNRVIKLKVIIESFGQITNNAGYGLIGSIKDSSLELVFYDYNLNTQPLINVEKEYLGVYKQFNRMFHLFDCRLA